MSRGLGLAGNARSVQESETRNIKARGQPRAQKQKGVLEQSISYAGTETELGGESERGEDTERRGRQKRVPRETSKNEIKKER